MAHLPDRISHPNLKPLELMRLRHMAEQTANSVIETREIQANGGEKAMAQKERVTAMLQSGNIHGKK